MNTLPFQLKHADLSEEDRERFERICANLALARAVVQELRAMARRVAHAMQEVWLRPPPEIEEALAPVKRFALAVCQTFDELDAISAGRLERAPSTPTRYILVYLAYQDFFRSRDHQMLNAVMDFTRPDSEPLKRYPSGEAAFAEIAGYVRVRGKFTDREEFLQALRIAIYKRDSRTGDPVILERWLFRLSQPLTPDQTSFSQMDASIRYLARLTRREMAKRKLEDSDPLSDVELRDLNAFLEDSSAIKARVARELCISRKHLYRVLARERTMSAELRERVRTFLARPPWTVFSKKAQELLLLHQ